MIIEDAQKAFDSPLVQFGVDNSIIVSLENIDAPTDTSIPFLSGFMLDVDLTPADVGVNESVDFIYQIDVRYPSHVGSAPTNRMIDLLRAKFPIGSYHVWGDSCFGVDELSVSPLPVDDGWSVKSISLTVSGFTPRLV